MGLRRRRRETDFVQFLVFELCDLYITLFRIKVELFKRMLKILNCNSQYLI